MEKNCQHQFPWNKLIFHSKNYPTLLLCKLCTRIVPVNSLLNFHANQLNKTILIDRCEHESLRILESLQNVIWHWISWQHISRIAENEGLWIIVVINCSLKCLSPAKTSNKLKTMEREQVSLYISTKTISLKGRDLGVFAWTNIRQWQEDRVAGLERVKRPKTFATKRCLHQV